MTIRCTALVAVAAFGCHTGVPRGPVLVAIDPAALPLLDAWADAVGGRDALARRDVVHVRARVERGGLAGTLETWTTASGARREELVLDGFLHETYVFDGARGWYADRNRWVRALTGFELEAQHGVSFLETSAALLPERRGGTVALAFNGGVVITAAGDRRPTTVSFDPASHLPRSYIEHRGEKRIVTELSDWRVVEGVREPFSYRSHDGDPHDDTLVTIDAIDGAPPPPGAFSRPPDRSTDAAFEDSRDEVDLPIDVASGSLVVLRAAVAGHPLELIVDSGADSSVLNVARLGTLGLLGHGAFAIGAGGGDTVASYVEHVTFELPGVRVRDQTVAAIHFELLESMFERPIDGILGYDFLSRFVVEIDYARGRLRLHDPARYRHAAAGAIPITLEGSTPRVDATIEVPQRPPLPGRFAIDTGCTCALSLTTPYTDANHLLEVVATTKLGDIAGAGGMLDSVSGEIAALHLGGATVERPIADFSRDAGGATANPDSAGMIGAEVFRRFVLVLDYARGRIWLDP